MGKPAFWPLGVAVALLASCAPAPVVLISPEAEGLAPAVEKAVPKGTKVLLESQAGKGAPRTVVRITTTPGWNMPSGVGPAALLPAATLQADKQGRYAMPSALAALGRRGDGSWSSVPLLFDIWGSTVFVADEKGPPPSGAWGPLFAKAVKSKVSVAGSRPSFRQTAYFFETRSASSHQAEAASWFSQAAAGWDDPAAALSRVAVSRALIPDAWRFARADQSTLYKPGPKLVFLETYRDFEAANPPGFRRFAPLNAGREDAPVLAGTVIFAEFRGDKRAAPAASRIVASLAAPEFQKAAGLAGRWLAANGGAPEIDVEGAQARRLVERASRFFPVCDRLPDPPVEACLLSTIQLASRNADNR